MRFVFCRSNRGGGGVGVFVFLMIRPPPKSPLDRSPAASDVYKRQDHGWALRRSRATALLAEADRLSSLAEIIGQSSLPGHERMVILGGRLLRDGDLPVSYTHLRAHATVLDLVCRLLFAKKNTQHKLTQHKQHIDHIQYKPV